MKRNSALNLRAAISTKEESARIVAALRDEDIDFSDMPDRGGLADWKSGNDRKHRPVKHKILA
jgi:hypothetical protein